MSASHPIKIIYLIGQLGLGGSERQLHLLLKYMDKSQFEPHVVVFNPSDNYTLDDDLRRAGVIVHVVPSDYRSVAQRVLWLYRLFRQVRPQIVHSWSIHDNVYAGVVGFLAGVPRRLGSVRDSINNPDFQMFPFYIRWLILHSVQGHLVNSESIAEELRSKGVVSSRISVLLNCVEVYRVENMLGSLYQFLPEGRLIGMVANLREKKNHLVFIRSVASLLSEFPDLYGVMVGQPVLASDPDVPERVQQEIELLGVKERVLLAGFHPYPPSLLPRFEIFCLPSGYEGTPNALLEAMAAGLPVVATRVGGIPNLVEHGVTGFLVNPGDVHELSQALRYLLTHPEKAREVGAAGRKRIERDFSPDAILPGFHSYYQEQIR